MLVVCEQPTSWSCRYFPTLRGAIGFAKRLGDGATFKLRKTIHGKGVTYVVNYKMRSVAHDPRQWGRLPNVRTAPVRVLKNGVWVRKGGNIRRVMCDENGNCA